MSEVYPSNRRTPAERSERFNRAWGETVDGILAAAAEIVAADDDMAAGVIDGEEHEAFLAGLVVRPPTVSKLRKIGGDVRLPVSRGKLPPSWTTLYALACLTDDEWRSVEAAGKLRPDMERAELLAFLGEQENNDIATLHVDLPAGRYATLVVDPPWPMQKIARQVRPNQVGFGYPTMTEEQLEAFQLPLFAAADCHLFLWTTHKFLPMAFRLLEPWGFRYVCCFVWHKPGGFQPHGLPQYNCEFALYCRRGSPSFVDRTSFFTCFEAARGEHSRKPDEFYDTVRRTCAGPRLDVFSREAREGFDQYGNEPGKFEDAA